ncbi:sigma-70 family RNA polymerase sigma factor [Prevotella multiformis]|uniref:Sigma-70 region 2 n=1 Tax=Prevotella multiformis DSM 16608 TaxID=888743 RepID=F0F3C0_9BACT|nr:MULTISPECIES: sigma-70 family RNA polymerase sigma factor [Prevotella]EGC21336.1 Sigma-70 region 2 [Prevotella multiformis DSM 16608]MBW4897199.1 sigma-70 family RNA polymerase sigma factor [Prevotella denticola]QUB70384.1 sigma-70 family RNA polymerase sigma factor [Prevotella multiformis]
MKKVSFRNDVLPLKNELFRLALRITLNRAEAEDIVQDTLIKVWNRREEWNAIDSIEAFSLTVCRNLSLDRIKKKGNDNDSLEDVKAAEPLASSNPQDRMIQTDKVRLIRQIVDGLPEKQRSCMQLRDFEGKTYKEIAGVLDISEEQVKVNIFRARQTVKQKYLKLDNYGL